MTEKTVVNGTLMLKNEASAKDKEALEKKLYSEYMMDITNDLLENADKTIDDQKRKKNKTQQKVVSQVPKTENTMRKPQHAWWKEIDNSYEVFIPILKDKPHAMEGIPLEILDAQRKVVNREYTIKDCKDQEKQQSLPQPYQKEITDFDTNLSADQIKRGEPVKPIDVDQTKFEYVDTLEKLEALRDHLLQEDVTEIAVDLEAHTARSYQGLTCLMQITTRQPGNIQSDFIVDTLKLRSEVGPKLRQVFADPTKLKVLHGADMDVLWLQRDFGIYIVNMFDTGQAARVLQLKGFGLAHLLQKYCGVLADKKY